MKINIDCKLDKLMLGWSCGKGSQGSFFELELGLHGRYASVKPKRL